MTPTKPTFPLAKIMVRAGIAVCILVLLGLDCTKITSVSGGAASENIDTGINGPTEPLPFEGLEGSRLSDTKKFGHAQREALQWLDALLVDYPTTVRFEVRLRHSGTHILQYNRLTRTLNYTIEEVRPRVWFSRRFVTAQRIHDVVAKHGSLQDFDSAVHL